MSDEASSEMIAVLLGALSDMREQLEEVNARCKQIEAGQAEIFAQLDQLGAAGCPGAGVDQVLTRLGEDRAATDHGLAVIAQVAALAHAAASGNGAPLPSSVADDPLLELYVLTEPADRGSNERALVDWQRVASRAGSAELAGVLARQYRPSATDTAETRRLRYRLAAITREELKGRGASQPPEPASTFPSDRSSAARRAKAAELAGMWRAGEGVDLYAEPELAGVMNIFAEAERQGASLSEGDLALGLADLHRTIADRLEAGDRLELATLPETTRPAPEVTPDHDH